MDSCGQFLRRRAAHPLDWGMRKRAQVPIKVPANLRLAGVKEQIARGTALLNEAHAVPDYDKAFPKLIGAVYPARAALEIMREAAKLGELVVPPKESIASWRSVCRSGV